MKKQFFLMTILVLTIAGFLLIWESPPESFLMPQVGKVEKLPSADSYMQEITSFKFSDKGERQFTLRSIKASFYNKESLLIVDKPTLSSPKTSNLHALKIVADRGYLAANTETLELKGNIDAQWHSANGRSQLTTDKMTYFIASDIARAEDGFQLKTPQAKVTGKTLSTDLKDGITTITSRVSAVYESR